MPQFIWLHGFASGPGSGKGRFVQAQLARCGVHLAIPDLNQPSFRELTVTRMLAQVDRLVEDGPAILFGSSLGGFTAATWAARSPDRCAALVLLAPAFDLGPRWTARMGRDEVARWEREGALAFEHYGTGKQELLSHAFVEDALGYEGFPLPRAPTLLLQGLRDEVVPPGLAEEFTRRMRETQAPVRLELLPDGHELNADLPRLWREIEPHISRFLPR